jgi:hypothetical protein
MRTISTAILSTFLATLLQPSLANEGSAASSKQRGYTTYCYGTPEQCMRGYRAARPKASPQAPRGYMPTQRGGREYDFPRFGSQRWWQQQEDRD